MKIAIVGCGATSISVVTQILAELSRAKFKHKALEILLFEKSEVGGLPYNDTSNAQLLNLPPSLMSVDAYNPKDFEEWLLEKNYTLDFVPRYLYGKYLKFRLAELIDQKLIPGVDIRLFTEEVKSINTSDKNRIFLVTAERAVNVHRCILAFGHSGPEPIPELEEVSGYFNDPWNIDWDKIPSDASVALAGSRLTALDVAKELISRGHVGEVVMYSRRGFLPSVRSKFSSPVALNYLRLDEIDFLGSKRLRLFDVLRLIYFELKSHGVNSLSCIKGYAPEYALEWIKKEINLADKVRIDQDIIGGIYRSSLIDYIWMKLPGEEKKLFLDRYLSGWMAIAHPIPLENAIFLRDALCQGQLKVRSGIKKILPINGGFSIQGKDVGISQIVINCKGVSKRLRHHRSSLVHQLLNSGQICEHEFGGMQIDPYSFHPIDRSGQLIRNFYAIGPMTCGVFFSVLAQVHNVRKSRQLAQRIVDEIKLESEKPLVGAL